MTLVTVLMPVYNGAPFLGEAVDSILGQTVDDFELLVVDDGSTDRTAEILRGYADPRLRLVHDPKNQGLVASLNRGLDLAQGRYLARMDADDVSLPHRLETQVRFLDEHPDVGVCGGGVETLGGSRAPAVKPWLETHDEIASAHVFGPGLAHPSVMLRMALVRSGLRYDAGYPHAEDYELWTRCARLTRLAAVPEVVLRYRVHQNNVSLVYRKAQMETAARIQRRQLGALGIEPTAAESALHGSLARRELQPQRWYVDAARRWLERLALANERSRCLPVAPFERLLGRYLADVARYAADHGIWAGRRVLASPLIGGLALGPMERLRLGTRGAGAELRSLYRRFA